ncbi:peptidase domain-containing ABC transporter [Streptomyces sp. NPDC059070]|uniref:peptidase domain-containing ABC transporter n=1 Tax=Streptomyces sp. NPDC059070 TaxID=3346713 RepID=UPI0036807B51
MRGPRRRVPMRFQFTRTECAAACLAMVLSHHGQDSSVADCRPLLGAGRDGVSAAALVAAAERVGLTSRVVRGSIALDQELTGPAIAYLNTHHFVVVESIDARWVRVTDPGSGRRRYTREEFDTKFGGLLVHLDPAPDFQQRRKPLRSVPIVRYLREFVAAPGGRRRLAHAGLLALLLQLLGLGAPFLTKAVVDDVLPHHRTDQLAVLMAGAVGLAVLTGVTTALRALALLALRRRGDLALTRDLVGHLFRLPMEFFLDRGRGDLLMRLSSVSTTRDMLTQQLLTLAMDGMLLCGYLAGLVLLEPRYLLVVAPLCLAQVLLVTRSHPYVRLLAQRELNAKSDEQSYLVESLEAIVPLKANGFENRAVRHWERLFTTYQAAALRRGRANAVLAGAQRALTSLGPLALLGTGAWLVLHDRLTLGGMLAANSLALSVLTPLETFTNSGQLYQSVNAQVERLYDALDTPPEASGTIRLASDRPAALRVDSLSYRYHPDSPAVLHDISLDLPAGGKLGIVGRTGSGKSTLALLLLGLLRAPGRSVRHDGVPIEELDLHDLRSHCGAVLQELTLFNGSIRENLTLGRPEADDAEVVRAARIAGLHEDVCALPMRYDTPVGEAGSALSAGQRQRVALARALVHRPRLIVLDEATSHLDPQTERQVDRELGALKITRVVVSHRVNAVRNADEILVLDRGRIAQRGRHAELIARPGPYQRLFAPAPAETAASDPPADAELALGDRV